MPARRLRRWPSIKPALGERLVFAELRSTQQTQSICITFVQCVEDVGSALYKCYTNVLCLLGIAAGPNEYFVCDHLQSFATICERLRRLATICDRFVTVCDHLRSFATVCDHLRPFVIVCDGLRWFATSYFD